MTLKFRFRPLMLLLALSIAGRLQAGTPDPVTLAHTEVRYLTSQTNGVRYKLYVSRPSDYAESRERYRVVYLLDADYSFAFARNIVEHLSERNHLQKLILVGIAYDEPGQYRLNRSRDYSPTHSAEDFGYGAAIANHTGGGPDFARFLEAELVPFVDATYRTVENDRALVGHSLVGLFGSWLFLTRPALFQRFILVSPSLWFNDHSVVKLHRDLVDSGQSWQGKVYFAVRSREHNERRDMVADLAGFVGNLREGRNPDLSIHHEVFDDETHNSVFPTALSRGLRWIFDGV